MHKTPQTRNTHHHSDDPEVVDLHSDVEENSAAVDSHKFGGAEAEVDTAAEAVDIDA